LILLTGLCLLVPPVLAGGQDDARVALHLTPANAKSRPCVTNNPNEAGIPCSKYVIHGTPGSSYHVFLVVAQADPDSGILGLSCGIDYNPEPEAGVDVFTWTLCSGGLDFRNAGRHGDWPEAQGGNRITWWSSDPAKQCPRQVLGEDGAHAVAGVFYIHAYGEDTFRVTRNNNLQSGPELEIGDCAARLTDLPISAAGSIRFSDDPEETGCNPCLNPCPDPPRPR